MIHAEITVRPDPFGEKVRDVAELAKQLLDVVTHAIATAERKDTIPEVSANVRYADMRFDRTTSPVQVLLFVTEHPWNSREHRYLQSRFLEAAVREMPKLGGGKLSVVVTCAEYAVSK